jgi:hypothetical protein
LSAPRKVNVDRRGRFYEVEGGGSYPSVTNILGVVGKPALINWAANTERAMVIQAAANLYEDLPIAPKMIRAAYLDTLSRRIGHEKAHTKELAKASEIGSQAHALIEWNLRKELGQKVGDQPFIGDKATWAFMAYEDWRKSAGIKPLMIEQTIWSHKHGYAGTIDLCADVKEFGALAVIDWKTGKAIYEEALLQNAAYVQALIEMGHAPSTNVYGMIVRLPKLETDPEFEVRVIKPEEQAELFQAFLSAKRLWEFIQKHSKWAAGGAPTSKATVPPGSSLEAGA